MPSRQLASHPDLPLPVLLCAMPTARRMRLRLDERSQVLKLTHPRRVRASAALAWAASQKMWVEQQLRQVEPALPFMPGAIIPVAGNDVELVWSVSAPRTPALAGNRLVCGGPEAGFAGRIESFLKRLALETLSLDTAEFAAKAGVRPASVAVGDARTRWGSCSSSGRIRYSWRLICADPAVRRYVVAHEVAHMKHLDHGPEFRAFERFLFGADTRPAERLLRGSAPRLRRIGVGN